MGQIPIHGPLWAYRNTPHEATGEKPSYLLYGRDCRYPIEAAFLPANEVEPADLTDYRRELTEMLTRARDHASQAIQAAQKRYKTYYDKVNRCSPVSLLIRFPQEESGKQRKLSRPWHGPYRVVEATPTGISAQRVYTAKADIIRVHLSRVTRCPLTFPAGYHWYGDRRMGPGRPPKSVAEVAEAPPEERCTEGVPEELNSEGIPEEQTTEDAQPKDDPVEDRVEQLRPPGVRTRSRIITPPVYYGRGKA